MCQMNLKKRRIKLIFLEISVAIFLIILGAVLSIILKKSIQKTILNAVHLRPDSDGFKNWCNPPVTSVGDYYLFKITNPIEIVKNPHSATIHVTETRAYSYDIKMNKMNVQWSNDTKTLNYAVERLFTRHPTRFDPSSVNDTGVFVDLIRAIFRTNFGNKPSQAFYSLAGMNTFAYRNAIEQLEGFTSDLFETVREKMVGPNTAKSGFIYRYNGSRLYNISIQADQNTRGQVLHFASELVEFNINPSLHYMVPVYDGFTFPTMLFDKPEIFIFNAEFCHPILIQFTKNVVDFGGIKMREYKIKLADFNHFKNSNNGKAFIEVEKFDVSKCVSDSIPEKTMFLSKPHFYGSNNKTIKQMNIEGFKLDDHEYDSYIYIEPYSGTPLKAVYRIQLNIEVMIDPMKQLQDELMFRQTGRKAAKRLIPILWIDQKIDISEKVVEKLRRPLLFLYYGEYISIGFTIGLAVLVIFLIEFTVEYASKNYRDTRGRYIQSEIIAH